MEDIFQLSGFSSQLMMTFTNQYYSDPTDGAFEGWLPTYLFCDIIVMPWALLVEDEPSCQQHYPIYHSCMGMAITFAAISIKRPYLKI